MGPSANMNKKHWLPDKVLDTVELQTYSICQRKFASQ